MDPVAFNQFLDKVVGFVGTASICAKRACDEVAVHRAMQKRASDAAPAILELLLKSGAVRAEQRDAAAAMLGSHAETLALLKSAVERLEKLETEKAAAAVPPPPVKQAGDLGRSVPGTAPAGSGYDSLNDNYLGRRTSQPKASDLAMLRVLD